MYQRTKNEIEKVGKTKARARFLPLVKSVGKGTTIAITERNKPVAVMMSWSEYLQLTSKSRGKQTKKNTLVGSLRIVGDLESGDREIAKLFAESLKTSGKRL